MDSPDHENGFSLRQARVDDAGAAYELSCQLAAALGDSSPNRDAVRNRLRELLGDHRSQVLVAESEGMVGGMAALWVKPDLAHGDTVVEIPTLVVDEGCRGRGVGRFLIEGVREVARGHGATLIELVATRDNASARGFYRSLGFTETDHITLEFVGGREP